MAILERSQYGGRTGAVAGLMFWQRFRTKTGWQRALLPLLGGLPSQWPHIERRDSSPAIAPQPPQRSDRLQQSLNCHDVANAVGFDALLPLDRQAHIVVTEWPHPDSDRLPTGRENPAAVLGEPIRINPARHLYVDGRRGGAAQQLTGFPYPLSVRCDGFFQRELFLCRERVFQQYASAGDIRPLWRSLAMHRDGSAARAQPLAWKAARRQQILPRANPPGVRRAFRFLRTERFCAASAQSSNASSTNGD